MSHEVKAVAVSDLIDERPVSGLQKRVMALCALAVFADGYDVQALGLVIPRMSAEFGLAPPAFAVAVSGSLIGMALGAALLSPLADRFGRRPLMIAMLWLVALTTFAASLSAGVIELALWRVLSGLGLGAILPVAITMTSEYAPRRRRAALVTLMASFTAVGAFTAGLVAPALDAAWGWRGIFGAGAVMPALTALLCLFAFPESLRILVGRQPDSAQVRRQLRRIAPGEETLQLQSAETGMEAAGVQRASVQALFSPALRQRTLLLWTLFWMNLCVNYALISWLPTLLMNQAGWDHASAVRASGVLGIGGVVGGLLISYRADRGRTIAALLGAYLLAAAMLVVLGTGPEAKEVWVVLLVLTGLGAFGAQIAIGSLTAGYYPVEVRSTGVGWASGFGRTGAFVGPLLVAALMSAGAPSTLIIGSLMAPMLLCALCVTRLPFALRSRGGKT